MLFVCLCVCVLSQNRGPHKSHLPSLVFPYHTPTRGTLEQPHRAGFSISPAAPGLTPQGDPRPNKNRRKLRESRALPTHITSPSPIPPRTVVKLESGGILEGPLTFSPTKSGKQLGVTARFLNQPITIHPPSPHRALAEVHRHGLPHRLALLRAAAAPAAPMAPPAEPLCRAGERITHGCVDAGGCGEMEVARRH